MINWVSHPVITLQLQVPLFLSGCLSENVSVFNRFFSCFCSEGYPASLQSLSPHHFSINELLFFSFHWKKKKGCQGDNGEQESLGIRDPFTLSHPSQQTWPSLTSSTSTSEGGVGIQSVWRDFVTPPSHFWRTTGTYCFCSLSPPPLWLLSVLAEDRMCWIFFSAFVWYFLVYSLTCFTLFILHWEGGGGVRSGILWLLFLQVAKIVAVHRSVLKFKLLFRKM